MNTVQSWAWSVPISHLPVAVSESESYRGTSSHYRATVSCGCLGSGMLTGSWAHSVLTVPPLLPHRLLSWVKTVLIHHFGHLTAFFLGRCVSAFGVETNEGLFPPARCNLTLFTVKESSLVKSELSSMLRTSCPHCVFPFLFPSPSLALFPAGLVCQSFAFVLLINACLYIFIGMVSHVPPLTDEAAGYHILGS